LIHIENFDELALKIRAQANRLFSNKPRPLMLSSQIFIEPVERFLVEKINCGVEAT
jgi:hypothetical protein